MDIIEYIKNLVPDTLQLYNTFTTYFDQHIAAYYLTSNKPVTVSILDDDTTVIRYQIIPDKADELDQIKELLTVPVTVYGKTFYPNIEIRDNILILTFR